MKRLLIMWQEVRYSLWLLPALIVTFSVLLAVLAIGLDTKIDTSALPDWPRVFTGSADGARGTLEVIAGAMITIAALTFSITILVLSMAASQYTPRVIRTFMGSTMTKTVLGVFVGVYVYCLLVLRTVRSSEEEFVPTVAVTIGLLLALLGVGFLIAFIHHMATSIQVSTIVSRLAQDTECAIEDLYPDNLGTLRPDEPADAQSPRTDAADSGGSGGDGGDEQDGIGHAWFPLSACKTGYLRAVNSPGLASYAEQNKLVLRMEKRVGEFIIPGELLASSTVRPDEQQTTEVNKYFTVGAHRTVEQDVGVGIRQLVDIALRAMSPAINDTTTAAMCLDYLTAILIKLAPRRLSAETSSSAGVHSLIVRETDFGEYLEMAMEQIRQRADGDLTIYLRLLNSLQAVGRATTHPLRRQCVEREANLVARYARANLSQADQLARVEQALQRTLAGSGPGSRPGSKFGAKAGSRPKSNSESSPVSKPGA